MLTGAGFDRIAQGRVLFFIPTAREERTATKSLIGQAGRSLAEAPTRWRRGYAAPLRLGTIEGLTEPLAARAARHAGI